MLNRLVSSCVKTSNELAKKKKNTFGPFAGRKQLYANNNYIQVHDAHSCLDNNIMQEIKRMF